MALTDEAIAEWVSSKLIDDDTAQLVQTRRDKACKLQMLKMVKSSIFYYDAQTRLEYVEKGWLPKQINAKIVGVKEDKDGIKVLQAGKREQEKLVSLIFKNQERLRENIKALEKSTGEGVETLKNRYFQDMNNQEDLLQEAYNKIEKTDKDIEASNQDIVDTQAGIKNDLQALILQ